MQQALREAIARQAEAHGWRAVPGARLGADRDGSVDLAFLHDAHGVALLDVAPRTTPEPLAGLRGRLQATAFDRTHPGILPVIYRQLPASETAALPRLLAAGFAGRPPPTVAAGWATVVQAALQPRVVAPELTERWDAAWLAPSPESVDTAALGRHAEPVQGAAASPARIDAGVSAPGGGGEAQRPPHREPPAGREGLPIAALAVGALAAGVGLIWLGASSLSRLTGPEANAGRIVERASLPVRPAAGPSGAGTIVVSKNPDQSPPGTRGAGSAPLDAGTDRPSTGAEIDQATASVAPTEATPFSAPGPPIGVTSVMRSEPLAAAPRNAVMDAPRDAPDGTASVMITATLPGPAGSTFAPVGRTEPSAGPSAALGEVPAGVIVPGAAAIPAPERPDPIPMMTVPSEPPGVAQAAPPLVLPLTPPTGTPKNDTPTVSSEGTVNLPGQVGASPGIDAAGAGGLAMADTNGASGLPPSMPPPAPVSVLPLGPPETVSLAATPSSPPPSAGAEPGKSASLIPFGPSSAGAGPETAPPNATQRAERASVSLTASRPSPVVAEPVREVTLTVPAAAAPSAPVSPTPLAVPLAVAPGTTEAVPSGSDAALAIRPTDRLDVGSPVAPPRLAAADSGSGWRSSGGLPAPTGIAVLPPPEPQVDRPRTALAAVQPLGAVAPAPVEGGGTAPLGDPGGWLPGEAGLAVPTPRVSLPATRSPVPQRRSAATGISPPVRQTAPPASPAPVRTASLAARPAARPAPPPPSGQPAASAPVRRQAANPPATSTAIPAATRDARCLAILNRAQLGELPNADRLFLRERCASRR